MTANSLMEVGLQVQQVMGFAHVGIPIGGQFTAISMFWHTYDGMPCLHSPLWEVISSHFLPRCIAKDNMRNWSRTNIHLTQPPCEQTL